MPKPKGFLTESAENYLRGVGEWANKEDSQKRYRLRKRIREAIFDFREVFVYLNSDRQYASKDRELIFDETDMRLKHRLEYLFAVGYMGLMEMGSLETVENILEQAIMQVEGVDASVDIKIHTEREFDLSKSWKKLKKSDDFDEQEVEQFRLVFKAAGIGDPENPPEDVPVAEILAEPAKYGDLLELTDDEPD